MLTRTTECLPFCRVCSLSCDAAAVVAERALLTILYMAVLLQMVALHFEHAARNWSPFCPHVQTVNYSTVYIDSDS